jgi:ISXO2-like transposase domain
VYTNTVESSFSLFKRGIYGTFHNVSKRHRHRYCAEFDFRWNTRKMDDGNRTVQAIQSAAGKRLMYRQPKFLLINDKTKSKQKKKRGPKPDILKIRDLNWEETVKRSFEKKKPPDGWPKF